MHPPTKKIKYIFLFGNTIPHMKHEFICFCEFFCEGEPSPKGSFRLFRRGGRTYLVGASKKKEAIWSTRLRLKAREEMRGHPPETGAVAVSVEFRLPRPKSLADGAQSWAPKRPDLDKLLRSALDALSGEVFADDARVVYVWAAKRYAAPSHPSGARVRVFAQVEKKGVHNAAQKDLPPIGDTDNPVGGADRGADPVGTDPVGTGSGASAGGEAWGASPQRLRRLPAELKAAALALSAVLGAKEAAAALRLKPRTLYRLRLEAGAPALPTRPAQVLWCANCGASTEAPGFCSEACRAEYIASFRGSGC